MHQLLQVVVDILTEVKNLNLGIKLEIYNTIDKKVMENGEVSASEVKNILSTFQNKVTGEVKDLISKIKNYVNKEAAVEQPTIANYESNLYYSFIYAQRGLNI